MWMSKSLGNQMSERGGITASSSQYSSNDKYAGSSSSGFGSSSMSHSGGTGGGYYPYARVGGGGGGAEGWTGVVTKTASKLADALMIGGSSIASNIRAAQHHHSSTHNPIPTRPINDGRANWMGEIRESYSHAGSSSYANPGSGGYNAYQSDFPEGRPQAYSDRSGGGDFRSNSSSYSGGISGGASKPSASNRESKSNKNASFYISQSSTDSDDERSQGLKGKRDSKSSKKGKSKGKKSRKTAKSTNKAKSRDDSSSSEVSHSDKSEIESSAAESSSGSDSDIKHNKKSKTKKRMQSKREKQGKSRKKKIVSEKSGKQKKRRSKSTSEETSEPETESPAADSDEFTLEAHDRRKAPETKPAQNRQHAPSYNFSFDPSKLAAKADASSSPRREMTEGRLILSSDGSSLSSEDEKHVDKAQHRLKAGKKAKQHRRNDHETVTGTHDLLGGLDDLLSTTANDPRPLPSAQGLPHKAALHSDLIYAQSNTENSGFLRSPQFSDLADITFEPLKQIHDKSVNLTTELHSAAAPSSGREEPSASLTKALESVVPAGADSLVDLSLKSGTQDGSKSGQAKSGRKMTLLQMQQLQQQNRAQVNKANAGPVMLSNETPVPQYYGGGTVPGSSQHTQSTMVNGLLGPQPPQPLQQTVNSLPQQVPSQQQQMLQMQQLYLQQQQQQQALLMQQQHGLHGQPGSNHHG